MKKIDKAYESIAKDFKKFKDAKIKEYQATGNTITDVKSYEDYLLKVFTLGTLELLRKGESDVKKTGTKRVSRKKDDSDGRQLKLGV